MGGAWSSWFSLLNIDSVCLLRGMVIKQTVSNDVSPSITSYTSLAAAAFCTMSLLFIEIIFCFHTMILQNQGQFLTNGTIIGGTVLLVMIPISSWRMGWQDRQQMSWGGCGWPSQWANSYWQVGSERTQGVVAVSQWWSGFSYGE